jgi:putative acetyltransferase
MEPAPSAATVRFRFATDDDLLRMNELVNDPDIARYLNLIPPVSLEKTLAFWEFAGLRKSCIWCVQDRETVVGCFGFIPDEPGTKLSHTAVFFVYLETAYQGKSIGMRAIQHLEAEARDRGFLRLECSAAESNIRAIRLYERAGFLREGVKRKAFREENGRYMDLIVMGKLLE